MPDTEAFNVLSTFLRLRSDAIVEPLPVDATFWPRIGSGALGSFHREYLVSCYDLKDSGAFLIVPPDTWHTARVSVASRVLFITAGEGTEHRAIG